MHPQRQLRIAMVLGRARRFLLDIASTSVIFSAIGFLQLPPSRDPCNMVHLLFFYFSALIGIALLFLSATIHKFPTAARATTSVADAIGRIRFRLLGLLIWERRLQGGSLATFYCSVWCAAALAYAVAKVRLCYYGLAWMSYALLALVGFSLVFLSATIRNFPTAARATAAVADAIARFRFRLLGLQTWERELLGRSFVTFYCSVWCAGALAYAIANVSLCYHGLACMCYLLFGVN